jgi:hypothetical protein
VLALGGAVMAQTAPSVESTELRERSSQLAALTEMLAAVAESGCGRLVLVYGEAGVGKTVLLRRFSEEAPGSARVLWGTCDELFTPRPLGPLFDIAGAAGRQLAEALEREATPYDVVTPESTADREPGHPCCSEPGPARGHRRDQRLSHN